MTSHEKIIRTIDKHIVGEIDSDRTVGNHCTRRSSQLAAVTPYTPQQIGAALGKHPEKSGFEITHPSPGMWRFRQ